MDRKMRRARITAGLVKRYGVALAKVAVRVSVVPYFSIFPNKAGQPINHKNMVNRHLNQP